MRKVWQTDRQNQAYAATHALGREGIFGQLRYDRDDGYSLWIFEDDYLVRSEAIIRDVQKAPNLDFQGVAGGWQHEEQSLTPILIRREPPETESELPFLKRVVTLFVMFICCGLMLVTYDGNHEEVKNLLLIGSPFSPPYFEISHGQVWRLWTPMFLHGGLLHLLFNMMWYWDLGSQMEETEGSGMNLGFLLAVGLICHVLQYAVSGPMFVGLSGVIYGQLAYIWFQSRYGTKTGYHIEPQTMVFMLIWLGLGIVGIIPQVANTEHLAGLVAGGLFGAWRSGAMKIWWRQKRRKM